MMKRLVLLISASFICFFAESQYNRGLAVETVLKTDTTSIGQKISYPQFKDSEVTISKINIPPGQSTGWHKHAIPVFAYVVKGTLTVEMENKKSMQFPENASFSEMVNTFHNGRNDGKEDVVLIAIYLGGDGTEHSVRK